MINNVDKVIVINSNDDDDEIKVEPRWRGIPPHCPRQPLDMACTLRYRQGMHAQKRYS